MGPALAEGLAPTNKENGARVANYEFELVPFSSEVLTAYQRFSCFLGCVPERKILWKFKEGPFGGAEAMLVRDANGTIVGMNAYQPVIISNSDGQTLRGHQSMDTVISEYLRGQGLFTRMYRAYYEQTDLDFVYGFPNKNSAHGLFRRLGWSRFGMVPMRLKALRTGFIARRLKLDFIDFRVPTFQRSRGSSGVFASFDEAHEAAWRSVLKRSPGVWGVDRTVDYLNWRYRDHPTNNYLLLSRSDGSFVVSTIRDKHGARILYLMEALGQPDTLVDMLREVHADACQKGAEVALVWGGEQSALSEVLRAVGYHVVPNALRGDNEINFGARIFTERSAPRQRQHWLISYSDSDTA